MGRHRDDEQLSAAWAGPALVLRQTVQMVACFMLVPVLTLIACTVVLEPELGMLTLDSDHDTAAASRVVSPVATRLEQLDEQLDCSHTGLGEGVIPQHAIVRRGDHLRVTSFDEGWAVYNGEQPGTLMSVCAR